MENNKPFISGKNAIESMRDNGFKSAAYALAEIIDNSIQAGANLVELFVFEKEDASGQRVTKTVDQIGIFDNGRGMDAETLHLALAFGESRNRQDHNGIGKFGMGLPNSSVSQCKRVDVWSWEKDAETLHTYLDIEEMLLGSLEYVPYPAAKSIPDHIQKCIAEQGPSSGTFVLWSSIDRCQWKTAKSIERHTEDIVGRMYRKFIGSGQVTIRFNTVQKKNNLLVKSKTSVFKANDPLYLIRKSSLPKLPGPLDGEAFFEIFDEFQFKITDEYGLDQIVIIRASIVKEHILDRLRGETNRTVGNTEWGKHTLRNQGVSIVRSDRELDLTTDFFTPESLRQGPIRFCGIEVCFSPALDRVFGVTNNKQSAVNLKSMNVSEDYAYEGFDSEQSYLADLRANDDPKEKIYEVNKHIVELRKKLVNKLNSFSYGGKLLNLNGNKNEPSADTLGRAAIGKINDRDRAREDNHPTNDSPLTKMEIGKLLEETGSTKVEADLAATTILQDKLATWVETMPMDSDAFFDVTSSKGFTLLQINENHAFYRTVLEGMDSEKREAIEICLAGWARMERECQSDKRKEQYAKARKDWGLLLNEYLEDPDEL